VSAQQQVDVFVAGIGAIRQRVSALGRRLGKRRMVWGRERSGIPCAAAVGLAAIVGLAACASGDKPEREIGAAQVAISQAESANASLFAPAELHQARQKLEQAQHAVRDDEYERAKQLADEATVDAQLAQAKAQDDASKQSLEEMQRNIEAIRSQSERDAGVAGIPGAGPATTEPAAPPWGAVPTTDAAASPPPTR
jgi:hypothetical protein